MKNLNYGLLPRPHFFSKNVKIKIIQKLLVIQKILKFLFLAKNFFSFNKFKN